MGSGVSKSNHCKTYPLKLTVLSEFGNLKWPLFFEHIIQRFPWKFKNNQLESKREYTNLYKRSFQIFLFFFYDVLKRLCHLQRVHCLLKLLENEMQLRLFFVVCVCVRQCCLKGQYPSSPYLLQSSTSSVWSSQCANFTGFDVLVS